VSPAKNVQTPGRVEDAQSQISNLHSEIELLPALPQAWPGGSVKGLRARGGFEVDVTWKDGKPVVATVRSLNGGSVQLRHGSSTRDLKLAKGETYRWNGR
jgi:alpha-L-fucosidase 2